MKAYLRVGHLGEFYNLNCADAFMGCKKSGIDTVFYKAVYSITDNQPEDLVVGSFSDVLVALEKWGIHPAPLDYPEELMPFVGRKIWKSTLSTVMLHSEYRNIFIKPVVEAKRFHGTVIETSEDLARLGGSIEDLEVWCSERVHFISEWRLWVLEGEIIGLTPYAGKWDAFPDADVLKKAVAAFHCAPAAYALDFGVTDDGKTLLVEASDGYGLSSCGLNVIKYVKVLTARWHELTRYVKPAEELSVED
jgi:hypothetical protein